MHSKCKDWSCILPSNGDDNDNDNDNDIDDVIAIHSMKLRGKPSKHCIGPPLGSPSTPRLRERKIAATR